MTSSSSQDGCGIDQFRLKTEPHQATTVFILTLLNGAMRSSTLSKSSCNLISLIKLHMRSKLPPTSGDAHAAAVVACRICYCNSTYLRHIQGARIASKVGYRAATNSSLSTNKIHRSQGILVGRTTSRPVSRIHVPAGPSSLAHPSAVPNMS